MGRYYAAAAAAGGGTVTFEAIGTAVRDVTCNSITASCVVGSQANRLLVAYCLAGSAVIGDRTVNATPSSDQGGTFLPYSGAAADDANFMRSEIWYMIAPATATHAVTVTWATADALEKAQLVLAFYSSVHQTTPFGTGVPINGTSPGTDPTTGSQTIGTGEMLTACIATDDTSLTQTLGTNRQLFQNHDSDVSYGVATLAATGAITWQTLGNQTYAISAGVIKPN